MSVGIHNGRGDSSLQEPLLQRETASSNLGTHTVSVADEGAASINWSKVGKIAAFAVALIVIIGATVLTAGAIHAVTAIGAIATAAKVVTIAGWGSTTVLLVRKAIHSYNDVSLSAKQKAIINDPAHADYGKVSNKWFERLISRDVVFRPSENGVSPSRMIAETLTNPQSRIDFFNFLEAKNYTGIIPRIDLEPFKGTDDVRLNRILENFAGVQQTALIENHYWTTDLDASSHSLFLGLFDTIFVHNNQKVKEKDNEEAMLRQLVERTKAEGLVTDDVNVSDYSGLIQLAKNVEGTRFEGAVLYVINAKVDRRADGFEDKEKCVPYAHKLGHSSSQSSLSSASTDGARTARSDSLERGRGLDDDVDVREEDRDLGTPESHAEKLASDYQAENPSYFQTPSLMARDMVAMMLLGRKDIALAFLRNHIPDDQRSHVVGALGLELTGVHKRQKSDYLAFAKNPVELEGSSQEIQTVHTRVMEKCHRERPDFDTARVNAATFVELRALNPQMAYKFLLEYVRGNEQAKMEVLHQVEIIDRHLVVGRS